MRWNVAWVVPLILLTGCMGDGKSTSATEEGTRVVAPSTSATPPTTPSNGTVPKYHPHDMWGDRATVILFDGEIELLEDPVRESYYRDGVVVSGYAEFDPRADGDDSTSIDKADVVFQGTKALVVKLTWSTEKAEAQIPGLTFLYKPANAARFTAIPNVQNGGEFYIPLSKGWADMPHQLKLSRWRFALEAFDPQVSTFPAKAYAARGEVQVHIEAINGGERSIDPPHPYNFLESNLRPAGQIDRTLDTIVVTTEQTGTHELQGASMRGWQVDAPHIVPWETTKLHAKLYYNYTGAASAATHELALRYTDASGPEVKAPTATTTDAGFVYYEIPVLATQADDPYATQSDWTWGVQPFVNGQASVGDFEGEVRLVLVAEGTNEVTE